MNATQIGIRVIMFALIAGGLWFGYTRYKDARQNPMEFRTQPATRAPLHSSVSASGTLSPLVDVTVGAQVSGRIMELHADYNDTVEKGQLLARIDPAVYLADVEQREARTQSANAQYREAQANAALKQKQIERFRELVGRDLMAPSELDQADADLAVAKARVASANAARREATALLQQARTNLEFTYIYSPVDGVVLSREVNEGQSLAANFETPAIFQIAEDLGSMQVNTSVAEADIGAITAGMTARFYVDAWPNRTYEGTVREVRLLPEEDSNVVTYDAVVDVPNDDRSLLPGMTATIDFVIEARENALSIPNAALRFQPPPSLSCDPAPAHNTPNGATNDNASPKDRPNEAINNSDDNALHTTIWILRDNTPTCIHTSLGITDGARTEVLSGDINHDDPIITAVDLGDGGKKKPRRGIL